MKKRNGESGFALIEVLLAVVVLAIGLLAGSKMQILGLNYTQGALTRSAANIATNDIIDRMRLNRVGVEDGDYDNADTSTLPTDPACIAVGCTPAELASHDIRNWARFFSAGTQLPSGAKGTISGPETNGLRTIRIEWKDYIKGEEKNRAISVSVII